MESANNKHNDFGIFFVIAHYGKSYDATQNKNS